MEEEGDAYQVVSYCLTEWLPEPAVKENHLMRTLTFATLQERNIGSRQLYLWSAPMNIVEQYQRYLDDLMTANGPSPMATQLFYNCTFPRFGPRCQYALDVANTDHRSLDEQVYSFYRQRYRPTTFTCYMHLHCRRGTTSMCLDWTEICDQIVDCEDGVDERECAQLDVNYCEEHQYQCYNGQCIDKVFWHDAGKNFECVDQSDEKVRLAQNWNQFSIRSHAELTFFIEDILCSARSLPTAKDLYTSSCQLERGRMIQAMYLSDQVNSSTDMCWLAVSCELRNAQQLDKTCHPICPKGSCLNVINSSCTEMIRIPQTGTLAFGHIFFLYTKEDMMRRSLWPPAPRYICYNDQLCEGFLQNKSTISFDNTTCRYPKEVPLAFVSYALARSNWYAMYLAPLPALLRRCNHISPNYSASCSRFTIYHCRNSAECIAGYQVCNGIVDCPLGEDEQCSSINGSCSILGAEDLFRCALSDQCMSRLFVEDGICQCGFDEHDLCEDDFPDQRYIMQHIAFPLICDGFTELLSVLVDGRDETDETECAYW